jgi:hypothetical protein
VLIVALLPFLQFQDGAGEGVGGFLGEVVAGVRNLVVRGAR